MVTVTMSHCLELTEGDSALHSLGPVPIIRANAGSNVAYMKVGHK